MNLDPLLSAVQQYRRTEHYLLHQCFPLLETKLNAAENEISRWQQRAFTAESKIKYLEQQLSEREKQTDDTKTISNVQHQVMMKTGAVMGEVIWKSFKNHTTVKMLVEAEETMNKYCALSQGIVESFLGSYDGVIPPQKSLEHVFIISVLGALTNLAAFDEGRSFLAKGQPGLVLLTKLLQEQEHWSIAPGRYLKRMTLTFAYNFSLVDNVAYFILSEEKLLTAVLKCVRPDDPSDVVGAAVAIIYRLLMVSMAAGIPSALPEKIPIQLVKSMTTSSDVKLVEISNNLICLMESGFASR
ncbi:uncharacterized protein LOC131215182 [Anopheles bellator]|uniref:uncharacterized protein LOC131215182 n=1 Tax=Anopheles bellator TaxID=139047 RepID=UPI0026482BC5|nr:uncharacterized protein LOC131215182 [Anopheles bellator]